MSIKSRVALGFAAVAFTVLAAVPARAAEATKCRLNFTLTEWAVGVKVAHGSGTVRCDNGQMAMVPGRPEAWHPSPSRGSPAART